MSMLEHLQLPEYKSELERKKNSGGGGYKLPAGRSKKDFAQAQIKTAKKIAHDFSKLKEQYKGALNPQLIFEININNGVDSTTFENELYKMGLEVLSIAEGKRGYWVVFASDEQLDEFQNRLKSHSKDGQDGATKYDFFNAVSEIQDIPIEKKIALSITQDPLPKDEISYIDVELWRMPDSQLNDFIAKLPQAIDELVITDKLIRNSFALLRVKLDYVAYEKILELKEVARVSRPPLPLFNPFEIFQHDIESFEISAPSEDASGILIIDSGIVSGHPLIKDALGDEENFQNHENDLADSVGHGTAVAGCALYGDIQQCIDSKSFHAHNWLFSAKVMYSEEDFHGNKISRYDPEKLMEHQFLDAVKYYLSNKDYKIKVVNISLGNASEVWHKSEFRQPPLASLIDEIAREYNDVVFVVSAGNSAPFGVFDSKGLLEQYPRYLFDPKYNDFNLINPATSALALTVGSIANTPQQASNHTGVQRDIVKAVANENQPSPFTRTGPGVNGMIKPELVEYGGNIIFSEASGRVQHNLGEKIITLSNAYPDKLFSYEFGTSFTAPKIARCCALVANSYPEKSANFIKNIVIQSADYSEKIDKNFWKLKKKNDAMQNRILTVGYGVPNASKAISSLENRVLFLDEGIIEIDKVKVFHVNIPKDFFATKGDRGISIALTYNPPVKQSRGDYYLGNTLEFKVFHSVFPDDVISNISVLDEGETESSLEEKYKVDLYPKISLRSKGCHQKASKDYTHSSWTKKPFSSLCIALINRNRWIKQIDENFFQDYCISLCIQHNTYSSLYSDIKNVNQISLRGRARVR